MWFFFYINECLLDPLGPTLGKKAWKGVRKSK